MFALKNRKIITARKRSLGKVIYLHQFVILFTGGSGIPNPPGTRPPPGPDPPWHQTPPAPDPPGPDPPGTRPTPLGPDPPTPLQFFFGHTVNVRAVRILLECILVCLMCVLFKIDTNHIQCFIYIQGSKKSLSKQ